MRQTIHNVKTFKISDPKELTGHSGTFTRDLIIIDDNGYKVEIILFAENMEALLPRLAAT